MQHRMDIMNSWSHWRAFLELDVDYIIGGSISTPIHGPIGYALNFPLYFTIL
ncbi:hypothetical protein Scep_002502 [Stephania cephalantha]|uniref:Uncharacterized protein n=1 Tax=Stephania cephalantha TaxID=152367 RepID=A0AAP0LAC2_9MAGN